MPDPNPGLALHRPTWQIDVAAYLREMKQRVMYLIIPDRHAHGVSEAINTQPTEAFQKQVTALVDDFIHKGTTPPEAVAPAIYNIADDILAGRSVSIRAGDYVSLQNHLRGKK